jgi:hypothetical protein
MVLDEHGITRRKGFSNIGVGHKRSTFEGGIKLDIER